MNTTFATSGKAGEVARQGRAGGRQEFVELIDIPDAVGQGIHHAHELSARPRRVLASAA
jgi:hypothetical protein